MRLHSLPRVVSVGEVIDRGWKPGRGTSASPQLSDIIKVVFKLRGTNFNDGGKWSSLNSRPEHINQVAVGSLKRLRVDAIDLYYRHGADPEVSIEDVAGAVKDHEGNRDETLYATER